MLKTKGLPDEGKWECRKGPAAKKWDIRAVPNRNQYELIKWLKNYKKKNKPFLSIMLYLDHMRQLSPKTKTEAKPVLMVPMLKK